VDRPRPRPGAVHLRAAAVLDPHPRHRVRRPAHLPAVRNGRDPLQPAGGGWLSGRYRVGAKATGPTSPVRQRLADRFDLFLPANQRKLEATEQIAELAGKAGITLIEMAIAFVLRHPAVTSAIIGPRTMEHLESQLPAAEVDLSDDVLDRIDEIVPPGVTINPADNGWVSPALDPTARRR